MVDIFSSYEKQIKQNRFDYYKKRFIILFVFLVLFSSAVGLTLYALRQSVNFFYLPSEITQTILHSERMIRLGGAVKKYSVHYGATGGVSFILTDFSKEFQIHYYGILPNLFREGQDIIAEGRFDKNGVFVATRVLAKHDERYMPREMVERLKKNGLWEDYNRNAY